MGHLLQVLILGLILAQLLWEGVMPAKVPGYDLNAPASVSVEEGLCVLIPCNFTYKEEDASPNDILYGYWYEQGKTHREDAVATNNQLKGIVEAARGRFHLAGNLEEGNCSLIITNARESDKKKYYFKMEKGSKARRSFRGDYPEPILHVTKRQDPEIQIQKNMQAGHPMNITCSTFGSCAWQPPKITWGGFPTTISPHLSLSGTKVYSSVLDFIPSRADHNRSLTCSVSYANGSSPALRQKTVRLKVRYPPQPPLISWKPLLSNQSVQKFTKASWIKVKEGDSILLHCSAEGYPLPTLSWMKGCQLLETSLQSSHVLKLSSMTTEDAGEYKCQAENTEGSVKASLQLLMSYPKDIVAHFLLILLLIKILCCFLFFFFMSSLSMRKKALLRPEGVQAPKPRRRETNLSNQSVDA